jgi:hypothetical protein
MDSRALDGDFDCAMRRSILLGMMSMTLLVLLRKLRASLTETVSTGATSPDAAAGLHASIALRREPPAPRRPQPR